VNQQTNK